MTVDEFEQIVKDWLATARHPRFHRPYTDLVYQPMIELLAYLRANGFKTFIVSGGGVEFMPMGREGLWCSAPHLEFCLDARSHDLSSRLRGSGQLHLHRGDIGQVQGVEQKVIVRFLVVPFTVAALSSASSETS
jgi:hypothetical protein